MVSAFRTFGERIRGAEAGLFYYAGHGMQVDGENFLIPVDAVTGSTLTLDLELIALKSLQRAMEPGAQRSSFSMPAGIARWPGASRKRLARVRQPSPGALPRWAQAKAP